MDLIAKYKLRPKEILKLLDAQVANSVGTYP